MSRNFGIVLLISMVSGPALGHPRSRRAGSPHPTRATSPSPTPSPRPLYQPGQTWYEFVFHQLNPSDRDWGAWYQSRRDAFLDQLETPVFWYSLASAMTILLLVAGWIKSDYDRKRQRRIMGEQMDRIRAHDAYSRQKAHEAIRIHNEHIELCNRAIEASGADPSSALAGNSEISKLSAELKAANQKISAVENDKRRLEAEVGQKVGLITALASRVDALGDQPGGNGKNSAGRDLASTSTSELLRLINSLQQQLYAEQERNKHLKGGA